MDEGYRAFGETQVHDVDDGRHEVVVDFPHEVLDTFRTDWAPGCFDESLNRMLPPMVWNHEPSELIGRAVSYESLGDRTRLRSRFSDFDAVPRARQAFAQIRDGDVPGFSFHFRDGESVTHPSVRGARRYVKARMLEHSPVVFPSIPGAVAAGVRADVEEWPVPDLDVILRLRSERLLDDESVRDLLGDRFPALRERITVHAPDLTELVGRAGLRDTVIVVDGDGAVSTRAAADDEDAATLAQAVDASLDEFTSLLDGVDTSSLPEPVQQAIGLAQAAGVAVDELLTVMGVDDPDGDRAATFSTAPWNYDPAAYTMAQLQHACLIPGDTKDDCHLPVREPDGTLNRAAVHAAAAALAGARGGVTSITDTQKRDAASKLLGLYSTLGDEPPESLQRLAGRRSLDADVARVLDRLSR